MKKNKLWLLVIPIVLIAIVCSCLAGIMIMRNRAETQYTDLIRLAEDKRQKGDYDAAIAAYEQAISLNAKKKPAYTGLLDLYNELGEPAQMESVIRRYVNRTNDRTLRILYADRIEELQAQMQSGQTPSDLGDEQGVKNTSFQQSRTTEAVSLATDVLSFISGASYEDYNKVYGSSFIAEHEGNRSVVKFDLAPFITVYSADDGNVRVDATGKPYANSIPTSVSVSDLSVLLIGMTGETTLDLLQKDISPDAIHIEKSGESYYLEFEEKGCRVRIACDEKGTIPGTDAWNEIVPSGKTREEGDCGVEGIVMDAVRGTGVPDATIKFRQGFNSTVDTPVEEYKTSYGGGYEVNLVPGEYTVEVSAAGYIKEYFEVSLYSWLDMTKQDFVISPELGENEIRIVLEWGSYPSDLDLYLSGTSSSGQDVFVGFTYKNQPGVASLDVDDRNGFGPETITITDIYGDYEVIVQDFMLTEMMAQSGATVKVYMPGEDSPTIINVAGSIVNQWLVCVIRDGTLTVRNEPGPYETHGTSKDR